jgi:hypothetical protein
MPKGKREMQAPEIPIDDPNTEAKLGETPNSAPNTPAEKRAVECFAALKAAELDFHEGVEFGKAAIELRAEIKASCDRNWMERLEQLGITYEKARYWISVVEGRPTQRGKSAAKAQELVRDWDAALAKLKPLVDEIDMLRRRQPVGGSVLKGELDKLADILGYKLVPKGAGNA